MPETVELVIRGFCSSDISNLQSWRPERPEDVYVPLEISIGERNRDGADLFSVLVCSPEALRKHGFHLRSGRHTWIVLNYDWPEIRQSLYELVSLCKATSWLDAAVWLSRFLSWEYEDYTVDQSH